MWKPEDSYAITRIDLPKVGTYGWQVRLQRRGRRFGKFFADRQSGGIRRAYELARDWRNLLIAKFEEDAGARVCLKSHRNSSGVVGVSKVSVSASNGSTYHFWQATWCPSPGERRCVKFSVKRHGERQAFLLAVEARRGGVSAAD